MVPVVFAAVEPRLPSGGAAGHPPYGAVGPCRSPGIKKPSRSIVHGICLTLWARRLSRTRPLLSWHSQVATIEPYNTQTPSLVQHSKHSTSHSRRVAPHALRSY
ncbi:hypothetical protein VPH35_023363 [Triticum aestivum]